MEAALILVIVFGFAGVVLALVAAHIRATIRHRTEVQKALIAKFSSPQELMDFLNSEAGKLLLQGMNEGTASSKEPPPRPFHEQVGITIAWGVLGICVGTAILLASNLTLPGALFTALGIGLVINSLLRVPQCPVCKEISEVSDCIRNLGDLPNARALPDPDWLWVRARISARQDAAAKSLRMWALRQTLRYGLLSAGAVWLFLDWMKTEGPRLDRWIQTIALPFVDPLANVAILALAVLGIAFVTAALILGRPHMARRLRYLGLL
ncbi:MAG: hypothetical protein WDO56_36190 [Gammaproteobacteria bacterium]